MGNALAVHDVSAVRIQGRIDERAYRRAVAVYRNSGAPLERRRFIVDARLQQARNAAVHVDFDDKRSFWITALGAEEVPSPTAYEDRPWWQRQRWWMGVPSTWLWIHNVSAYADPNLLYECPERIDPAWPVYAALRQPPLVWRLVAPSTLGKTPSALAHSLWRQLGVVHVDDADAVSCVAERLRKRLVDADEAEIAHMASRCVARATAFVSETVPLYDECAGIGTAVQATSSLVDFADADVIVYHEAVPAAVQKMASVSSSVNDGVAMLALAAQLRDAVEYYCLERLIPLKRLHRTYWAYRNNKSHTSSDLDLWTILRAADWLEFWAARGYSFRAGHA